jgi:nucleotide-binding universal stress UspA family protein
MALRKILVPLDGSAASAAALEHAVTLAEGNDAIVDAIHVDGDDAFGIGSTTPLAPSARVEVEREIDAAIGRARLQLGPRISFHRVAGEPVRSIVELAASEKYDLIVVGTHARIGRLHSLVGSVTEGVVRNAPCPVLTVREPSGEYQSFAERRHGTPTLAEQVASPISH